MYLHSYTHTPTEAHIHRKRERTIHQAHTQRYIYRGVLTHTQLNYHQYNITPLHISLSIPHTHTQRFNLTTSPPEVVISTGAKVEAFMVS